MKLRPRAFAELARTVATVEAAGNVALSTAAQRTSVTGWGVGIARLAPFDFAPPVDVWSREAAMSIPTISRARDLLCSAVGALPLTLWSVTFTGDGEPVEQRLPPAIWMNRPDPNRTRQWMLSWTTDDLLFAGRAYWHVTARYESTTYPSAFELMRASDVSIDANGKVSWRQETIPPEDVVEFLSPLDGLLTTGFRAINTAMNLDAAAERFSTAEIPAGWLSQRENSEPLTSDELTEMANDFAAARRARTIAALNPYLEWNESTIDPSRLQLLEARQHQATELARLANIPAYLVSAPTGGGMTYQNAVQAKQDLIDFGAGPMVGCIEQTLGGPNVTPRGQAVRLDMNAWLRNPYVSNANAAPTDLETAYNAPSGDSAGNSPPQRAPGRPRQIDGLNEGTRS